MDSNDKTRFSSKNTLRSFNYWTPAGTTESLKIDAGKYASFELTDNYNSGLAAASYRKLKIKIQIQKSLLEYPLAYVNYLDLVLRGSYTDDNDRNINIYDSINIGNSGGTVEYINDNAIISFTKIIDLGSFTFNDLTVYIFNRTDTSIDILKCELLKSIDVTSDQVADSLSWAVTLDKVVAYNNGCELYYTGSTKPERLYWLDDANGVFAGVDINHTRQILFNRNSSDLE